jgi:PhnB protein
MAARLNPYLSFDGDTQQAMEFYQSVLGGNLELRTFGEFGAPDASIADKIMHSMLETDKGFTLMAADLAPGMEHQPGHNITVSLSGDDADLRGYFEKLSEGGTVSMPLEKQMWGDEFGMFTDKFGVPWMVNIAAQ